MQNPKVLIACESSGIVREAFRKQGINAISCDIKPSEIPGQHIQANVLSILNEEWTAIIGFPPCTYLTYASNSLWTDEARTIERIKAVQFFMKLYTAPAKYICIENPRGIMMTFFRQPDQIIHPYFFGDQELKRTCLWLKNLPTLTYRLHNDLFGTKTAVTKPKPYTTYYSRTKSKIRHEYFTGTFSGTNKNTKTNRSRTFHAIANAMASQWSPIILNQ